MNPGARVVWMCFDSAPEVLTGSYTAKIDIFSFGVLLVQMCTGKVPSIERRQQHVATATTNFPDLAPLIRRCLEPDAAKRPTADELVGLLERFKLSAAYSEYKADHSGGVLVERVFRYVPDRCGSFDMVAADATCDGTAAVWPCSAQVEAAKKEGIAQGKERAQEVVDMFQEKLKNTSALLQAEREKNTVRCPPPPPPPRVWCGPAAGSAELKHTHVSSPVACVTRRCWSGCRMLEGKWTH